MWNEIIGKVKSNIPHYNNNLLLDYRKNQVNNCVNYMDLVYKEAIKLFDNEIEYVGYRILSPENRIQYKLENALLKGEYDIQHSELQLVEFSFKYDNNFYRVPIYLPYYYNHSIMVSNSQYFIQLAIIEKVIYRSKHGIIVKVMRSPLHFWRNEQYQYMSTSGKYYFDPLITIKAHYKKKGKKKKRDFQTTIILYLISIMGFNKLLLLFNMDHTDISFVQGKISDMPNEGWEYFDLKDPEIKNIQYFSDAEIFPDLNQNPEEQKIYMKVKADLLNDPLKRRIVSSLLYTLVHFHGYTLEELYDDDAQLFKIILGKATHGMERINELALGDAKKHLRSVSTYLDPITRDQLNNIGVPCNDIYDLFHQVFIHIDEWLVYHSPSDLFEKKLSVIELLMTNLVKTTFLKFYELANRKKNMMEKNVKKVFKMKAKVIQDIYMCNGLVRSNPAVYNSNWLITIGCKKVRQPANQNNSGKNANILTSKEHLFHWSMAAVESLLTIPSSSPGTGGSINPFIEIDENGCFIVPDYSKDISDLQTYITNF